MGALINVNTQLCSTDSGLLLKSSITSWSLSGQVRFYGKNVFDGPYGHASLHK